MEDSRNDYDHVSVYIVMLLSGCFNAMDILTFALNLCAHHGLGAPGEELGGQPCRGHLTQRLFLV